MREKEPAEPHEAVVAGDDQVLCQPYLVRRSSHKRAHLPRRRRAVFGAGGAGHLGGDVRGVHAVGIDARGARLARAHRQDPGQVRRRASRDFQPTAGDASRAGLAGLWNLRSHGAVAVRQARTPTAVGVPAAAGAAAAAVRKGGVVRPAATTTVHAGAAAAAAALVGTGRPGFATVAAAVPGAVHGAFGCSAARPAHTRAGPAANAGGDAAAREFHRHGTARGPGPGSPGVELHAADAGRASRVAAAESDEAAAECFSDRGPLAHADAAALVGATFAGSAAPASGAGPAHAGRAQPKPAAAAVEGGQRRRYDGRHDPSELRAGAAGVPAAVAAAVGSGRRRRGRGHHLRRPRRRPGPFRDRPEGSRYGRRWRPEPLGRWRRPRWALRREHL
mmetsp:Transcript_99575/g.286038  ORF Transcript_99575/g.286038 Transcript_99575/m.286038 type:complete len:391 (+) Transcript_99575:145-1317(+)